MPSSIQYVVYVATAAVSLLAALLILRTLSFRHRGNGRAFLSWGLAAAMWTLAFNIAELFSPTKELCLAFSICGYFGLVAIPPLWFLFSCAYVGRLPRRHAVALLPFAVPAITMLLVVTNGAHGLHWSSVAFERVGVFSVLHFGRGPWFWAFILHAYALVLAANFLIGLDFFISRGFFSRQASSVASASLIPLAANLVYLLRPFPGLSKDFSPVAFCLATLVIAISIRRYRLFDLMPVGYRVAFDTLRDAVVIVDAKGRITDANVRACALFGLSHEQLGFEIGRFPGLAGIMGLEIGAECRIGEGAAARWFELHRENVSTGRGSHVLCSFHDITDRKALYMEKCDLVDQLIKALAEIRTLQGIIPICSHCKKVRDDTGYWHQVESYISSRSSAEFSHGLCPDCTQELYGDLVPDAAGPKPV